MVRQQQTAIYMLWIVAAFSSGLHAQTTATQTQVLTPEVATPDQDNVVWYDIRKLGIEGQGWTDTESPFDRLPARAKKTVRPSVWGLSKKSAGLCVRFVTDAPAIHANWKLTSATLAMPHMPATGVSGLDLYAKDDSGKLRWLAFGRPTAQNNKQALVSGLPTGEREYMLYLPLYNGVSDVQIGIPKTHTLKKAPARKENQKPIVFYGTSITQGGCASRPGMVHTAILGRWLDHPVINLGFSGNGEMEASVGEFIAELDASAIVIDCLPNMVAREVKERTVPLVQQLRKSDPTVPILLVEDRNYTSSWLLKGKRDRNIENQEALKAQFEQIKKSTGDKNLYYLSAKDLLGDDDEGTVDSSHPTDLGFFRQAEAFDKVLRPMLSGSK